MRYTVEIHYGPYDCRVDVLAPEDAESETVIAKAWARLDRQGLLTLPMAAMSARIVGRSALA